MAGAGGVENKISRTNIMDNPDTYDWLMPGELLLSTGYIFKDNEELQRLVIQKLASIKCAGLALKTNRYFAETPACMIEEAEKYNFPLMELPYGHSLSEIVESVSHHLYLQQTDKLSKIIEVQRQLNLVSVKVGRLQAMTRIAVCYLDNPVLLMDSNWRLLAWEDCPKNPYPLDSVLSLQTKMPVFPKDFTEGMPQPLEKFIKPVTQHYKKKDGDLIICKVVPVRAFDSRAYGYIVVWETVRSLDSTDYMILEQIATNVALERIRVREIEEAKVRVRKDFFNDILSGHIESLSAVRSLAESHGLKSDVPYRCILIGQPRKKFENPSLAEKGYKFDAELCADICFKTAKDMELPLVSFTHGQNTVLLVEQNSLSRRNDAVTQQYINTLCEVLSGHFTENGFMVVVGETAGDITTVSDAYKRVQSTVRIINGSLLYSRVVYVDDYSVYYLLEKYIDKKALEAFSKQALGDLIEYDMKNNTFLLDTLDAYFANTGNITEMSKHMYIHRNTCIYRMGKIRNILNDDFTNPMTVMKYRIALIALKILES